MELKNITKKIPGYFKKYKFVLLILIVGVVLMLFPSKDTAEEPAKISEDPIDIVNEQMVLKQILSKVKGAGRVEVMLTKNTEAEYVYQTDEDSSASDSGGSNQVKTVIVSEGSKNENGLIKKINAPVYRGAVIVCDGGDDPVVRYAIIDAVSKITGLGSNHIAVLKMK